MTENVPTSPWPAGAAVGNGASFYRHSGRAPMNAFLAGMLVAVVGGAAIGAAWGFVELYLHLAPAKVQIIGFGFGLAGVGIGLGYFTAAALTKFKGRSAAATAACTLASVAAAYYAAWIFFEYAWELYRATGRPLWDIAGPTSLLEDVKEFYSDGLWHFLDEEWMPKGTALLVFWGIEFFTLVVVALKTAMKRLNKRTFCEQCETWGTERPIMEISDENWRDLQTSLKAGDVNSMNAVKGRADGFPSWCDVKIEGCPTCDNVQTLTVTRTVITQKKKGKASKKTTDVVRRLVMTPEQTVQVAVVAAGLKADSGKAAEF